MQKFDLLVQRAGFQFAFFSKAYLSRLVFSMSILISAIYLNTLSSVVAGYRTPNLTILDIENQATDKVILPDFGHDLWGYLLQNILGF